jgi:hypothetical protein
MPKYFRSVLFSLLFITFLAFPLSNSFGASLQLTKIGALDLGGKMYNEWWYTGTYPTFFGTAEEDSTVTIVLNDDSYSVSANSSGDWSYPTGLPAGDHSVTISQGGDQIAFTLHLGQDLPSDLGGDTSTTTQSTGSVPDTGIDQIAAMLFGTGIIMLAAYFYFWGDTRKHTVFEQRMLKE